MPQLTELSRRYWRGVLAPGGFTAVPRWTLDPRPGVSGHEQQIPEDIATAVRRLAEELSVPLGSVLLAAHVKTLAALSGEREVLTGYRPLPGGRSLPCRVSTEPGTWRGLLEHVARAHAELLAHAAFPVDEVRRELGLSERLFETELDPAGADGDLGEHTVLSVGVSCRDGRLVLRVRYRADVLDAASAGRITGYHLTALALMAADPGADHRRQSLLSTEELRYQLNGLCGAPRELPDRRVHELFEERVAAHPDAIAAVLGDRRLTYRELNARANRLGRALLARGLRREEVVAVVTERNLDWMAAVLAVFKAGGAYLPLEPHFPAGRIAAALVRAECRLVLTERGSTTNLVGALDAVPGARTLLIDEACAEGHADGDLGVEVTPDQLAYVLFTSGSTGEPKGAMCEHTGMLNHIYAKLDDLSVGEGEVIPQTGPQCFDISIWQLVGALLVGGTTLLVEQDVILDVERLVDTLVKGRAGVLQAVPSYLDVVVSYLEQHPRPLPDLHSVSPTGDFVKKELVQRWFAAMPGITVVNTYGLTETSDDAVHEVMDRVPERDQVPLGRPIGNVSVDVVDENLCPVPLGAPGLIVFSGVCVGRGYLNDPGRTRELLTTAPHRRGRVCRTGDYGRWQPEGKLEFLGRRDNQVKIRGFRIEIGEIENALLRVPDVRDGAVVVADGADGGKRLVAHYTGRRPLAAEVLRDHLAAALPEYMVPSAFRWRDRLPLTGNGKIDRNALVSLAVDTTPSDGQAPTSPTERRLAAAWAAVLGMPAQQVGRHDHFFDRGGTSLSAVKLVIALGRVVSLPDLRTHPVLADLAALLDRRAQRPAPLVPAPTEPLTSSRT